MSSNDNDDEPADEWPWATLMREFWLTETRIVATLGPERGAIVETPPRLLCSEGRMWTLEHRGEEDGTAEQLEYGFNFACHEDAEPLPSETVDARIIISGTHSNGLRIEIRGDGWIGYDEQGRVEGRYDQPPYILIEADHDDDEFDSRARRHLFELPEHFQRACMKVPLLDGEPGPHLVRGR